MQEIDQKDRRLLYELDLNARLGTTILGKKIGLSQENVFYRMKRLEQKGIISGYITLINFGKLGYTGYGIYARFQGVSEEKKQHILNELKQHKNIYWIAEFGGKYDIAFAIMAKNIIHFNEIYSEIATKYNDSIKDFTIAIRVILIQLPRKYLLNNQVKEFKIPFFGKKIEEEKLDRIDEQLLREISTNCRTPILEIARKTNSPASTLSAHLNKLEKSKVIQGFSAKIHCRELGYESYQLFIKTHNLTIEKKKKIMSYCESHPNIIFCIETVGNWNYEIIYEVPDQEIMQKVISDFRSTFSDIIQDVESSVLFNHYVKYNQSPF